ncbi:GGDEF domain-containing protein [Desulforamulus aeronauticus]|uniref:Diguanylate cyclase (GGDEF) domain-containing protein n=1 Tax=Desulforamulus aeronauticus DSM 10349 TaxID=1121421 RepID=A0A1M6WW95_9FIRM|nr:GGDEF domain-containing protein [Desulforamulus aeronauticus]SHK98007.1 diguanylate cyclase (GGDEF) domain-containing protein [Desulforamulus aeronauticus DSM 10349]
MGLTEITLQKLRMANLRLKMLLIIIVCTSLLIADKLSLHQPLSSAIFLPLHTNIEFFCVFVALCTFTVTWYSNLNNCCYYSFFIGLGLLAVGFIDLFHFYSYEGMPTIFAQPCPNQATLYHVIGRYIMAVVFLVSVYFYKKEWCYLNRFKYYFLAATLGLVGFVLVTVSYDAQIYPAMYTAQGLTQAKIICEYIIIGLLVAAVAGYLWLYKKYMDNYLQLIIATLTISIFSELCFISYEKVYDTTNLLGHIFRFASYILIYVAIFMNNVKKPYLALVEAREELASANDILEERVRQRTKDLQEANKRLSKAATHDYLTGAINRMEFSHRFSKMLENSKEESLHSVIALDFDSFKKINDTFGHAVGDECLKTFVKSAKEVVRPTDTVSRFGGDEFMILLPNTPWDGARVVGEKVRKRLAEVAEPPFTVSMGIAEWPKNGRKEKDLLAYADEALYLAKQNGKNRME